MTDTLVLPASTRPGSINTALADRIATAARDVGVDAEIVNLRDHPMPLYDAVVEERGGIPLGARRLAASIAAAERVVVVTPEYNGAFTPLLKNTVDWLTRVDTAILASRTILLASASPGQGGGANAVALTRSWFESMRLDVAPKALTVGGAALADDGSLPVDAGALSEFVGQLVDTELRPCA